MNPNEPNHCFDKFVAKVQKVSGVDYIYFLNEDYNIIKEQKIKNSSNYLQHVQNIIKEQPLFSNIENNIYSSPFHTFTFLNESGLLVISKFFLPQTYYMVIIAGENEPVDLIHLLKICKESREELNNLPKT